MSCSTCKYTFCKYDSMAKHAFPEYMHYTNEEKRVMCYTCWHIKTKGTPPRVSPQDVLEEKMKNANGKFTKGTGNRLFCEECNTSSCNCPNKCDDCGAETSKTCTCRVCFKQPYILDCDCCEE